MLHPQSQKNPTKGNNISCCPGMPYLFSTATEILSILLTPVQTPSRRKTSPDFHSWLCSSWNSKHHALHQLGVCNRCHRLEPKPLAFLSPELPRFLSQYSASFHTKPWPPCNLYRSPFICSICGKMVLVLPVRWLKATKNKSYCKALCVE